MPLYVCKCDSCGARQDYVRTVDERLDTPACDQCGGATHQIITPLRVIPDIEPYQSPVDGRVISGRRARRDDFKRHNCRPWEGLDVERREAERWRAEQDKKLDRKLEEGIARTLHELPNGRALM